MTDDVDCSMVGDACMVLEVASMLAVVSMVDDSAGSLGLGVFGAFGATGVSVLPKSAMYFLALCLAILLTSLSLSESGTSI